MQSAHEILGLPNDADTAQIQAAYRCLVKRWHPDVVDDPAQKSEAQDRIVEINRAYKTALKSASDSAIMPDPIKVAKQLVSKKQYEAALHVLSHSSSKEAEWFYLQGYLLMKLHRPAAAHDSFRVAVRQDPANENYRRAALEAAVEAKYSETVRGKMGMWMRAVVRSQGKKNSLF